MVGTFTGPIDPTLSSFLAFIPSTSDSFTVSDPAPGAPPFAAGQLFGSVDDDGDGGNFSGGVMKPLPPAPGSIPNGALDGLKIYLVMTIAGGSPAAAGPLDEIAVFSSTLWPVFPTNVGTGGGPSGGDLPTTDDVTLVQNLIDEIWIGGSVLGGGPGGANLLTLVPIPEPAGLLLVAAALSILGLHRRRAFRSVR